MKPFQYNLTKLLFILQAVPGKLEAELPNGLICGHAYSITSVNLVCIVHIF